MCLSIVSKVLRPIDWNERFAWKIFDGVRVHGGRYDYVFLYQPLKHKRKVRCHCWLKAEVRTIGFGDVWYRSGFHCFISRKAARAYADGPGCFVVRVRVRGVQTIGSQCGNECIVAREMFVPKREKAK